MKRIILALLACASVAGAEERRSGLLDMRPEAQAMQRDDSMNPGMLWVLDGEALWGRKPTPATQSCADCHGDAAVSMRDVAARYPAFDIARGAAIDLAGRIIQCRETRQGAAPLARATSCHDAMPARFSTDGASSLASTRHCGPAAGAPSSPAVAGSSTRSSE